MLKVNQILLLFAAHADEIRLETKSTKLRSKTRKESCHFVNGKILNIVIFKKVVSLVVFDQIFTKIMTGFYSQKSAYFTVFPLLTFNKQR